MNHYSQSDFNPASVETARAQALELYGWDLADRAAKEKSVRRLIKRRSGRERHFGSGLFYDPAWDLLLELYSAKLKQHKCNVTGVIQASNVSHTTGLRWLDRLAQRGLVSRLVDRFDPRRTFVELTDEGESVMNDYFRCVYGGSAPI